MGETPFCLLYKSEVVIQVKIEEVTLRVWYYEKWANDGTRSFDLNVVDEKEEAAQIQILKVKIGN